VLLLSVLEPWLITLAREQQAGQLQPQTATSAAALVAVFSFGQVGLLLAACVMAFGFKIRQVAASVGRRLAPSAPAEQAQGSTEPSRAQRLAFDLQRDPAQAEGRARSLQLAAATASPGGRQTIEVKQTARLGDDYRRPVVASRRLKVS
jgi:hypothetical protein